MDNETKKVKSSENKPTKNKNDKNEFINKLPLILAIIGIVAAIGEGLGTPMLMGWSNIILAMLCVIAQISQVLQKLKSVNTGKMKYPQVVMLEAITVK